MYEAVHEVVAPGSSVDVGQLSAPTLGSVTVTGLSVTLPVLVTTNVYAMVLPTVLPARRAGLLVEGDRRGARDREDVSARRRDHRRRSAPYRWRSPCC